MQARDRGRTELTQARGHWHRHFAAGFLEILERRADLDAALTDANGRLAEATGALDAATLTHDELCARTDLAERAEAAGSAEEGAAETLRYRELGTSRLTDERAHVTEELGHARTAASGWSGTTPAEATEAVTSSRAARDHEIGRLALAREAERAAEQTLEEVATGGGGLAGSVVDALHRAGVGATGLLDGTTVADDERARWEPVLSRWSDAVVLDDADDLQRALAAAAGLPGAVLVTPTTQSTAPSGITSCPSGAQGLLSLLADRFVGHTEPDRATDATDGVHIVGGFPAPIAGRDARRAVAASRLDATRAERGRAEAATELAGRELAESDRELQRSLAAAAIPELESRTQDLDEQIRLGSEQVVRLREEHQLARNLWVEAKAEHQHHAGLVSLADQEVDRCEAAQHGARAEVAHLEEERKGLPVDYWQRGWGQPIADAREVLVGDNRRAVTFRRAATEALNRAVWELGTRGPDEAPTAELTAALRSRAARRDDDENTQAASFDEVSRALTDHLDGWVDSDRLVETRITADRDQREQELRVLEHARDGSRENLDSIQDATATLIEGSLHEIGAQLDRLRRESGHYGAKLDVDPVRPEGPAGLWEWRIIPSWQRVHGGTYTRYDTRTNTAQEKLFTVHLVLAALLAAPDPQGRVLILDELGDSLGDEHRRQVLEAITATATRTGITVLGTCQDSVLADAAGHCGEILYLEHVADSEALNRPTRMFGYDPDGERVELSCDAVVSARPPV